MHGNPPPATWAGTGSPPATLRFVTGQHRRLAGLFDIWLEPHPDGDLVAAADPDTRLTARHLVDMVRRSGGPADDVRVLIDDGERWHGLFDEASGLLGRDILISPSGSTIRHLRPAAGEDLFDAVPVDRVTGWPVNWKAIQPPDLWTPLPGWFALEDGVVRPRTGPVSLPLPDGLTLATRADFVVRRATAHRMRTGFPGLATVAVTVRAGGFLVEDYRGFQDVYDGNSFAAILADLPLYGCDLRLWLTWPPDPAERDRLVANAAALADATGVTVWTPPPGGTAELTDDGWDLRALDPAGAPDCWQPHRPPRSGGDAAFQPGADGRLMPARSVRATVLTDGDLVTATPPPEPTVPLETVVIEPSSPPVLAAAGRRTPAFGVPWLRPGQRVNEDTVDMFVISHREPTLAARDGIPTAELFLLGRLDPRPPRASGPDGHVLRIRVGPGGAIATATLRSHVPASYQHLLGAGNEYLLPAGRLNACRLVAGYRLLDDGRLSPVGEFDTAVRLDCAGARHGIPGLPNEVCRWPDSRAATVFALVSVQAAGPPSRWLRLYHKRPPAAEGRLLLRIRVPAGRAIDMAATADALGALPVRSRAGRILSSGAGLVLPARGYDRVNIEQVWEASPSGWRQRPGSAAGSLTAVFVDRPSPPAGT